MKLSAKTDYASKALVELAKNWPNTTPVCIQTIAERQNIPLKFLTQILLNLKNRGFVQSLRGKSGGYLISRNPSEISLYDIIDNFENLKFDSKTQNDVIGSVWKEIDEFVLEKLKNVNFEMILNKQKSENNIVMFHI